MEQAYEILRDTQYCMCGKLDVLDGRRNAVLPVVEGH